MLCFEVGDGFGDSFKHATESAASAGCSSIFNTRIWSAVVFAGSGFAAGFAGATGRTRPCAQPSTP